MRHIVYGSRDACMRVAAARHAPRHFPAPAWHIIVTPAQQHGGRSSPLHLPTPRPTATQPPTQGDRPQLPWCRMARVPSTNMCKRTCGMMQQRAGTRPPTKVTKRDPPTHHAQHLSDTPHMRPSPNPKGRPLTDPQNKTAFGRTVIPGARSPMSRRPKVFPTYFYRTLKPGARYMSRMSASSCALSASPPRSAASWGDHFHCTLHCIECHCARAHGHTTTMARPGCAGHTHQPHQHQAH